MFGYIKSKLKMRPQANNWYLIYGYEDVDDEKESHYYVAEKWSDGNWISSCGKNIVNVTYYEPLFNQPERSKREDLIECGDCFGFFCEMTKGKAVHSDSFKMRCSEHGG